MESAIQGSFDKTAANATNATTTTRLMSSRKRTAAQTKLSRKSTAHGVDTFPIELWLAISRLADTQTYARLMASCKTLRVALANDALQPNRRRFTSEEQMAAAVKSFTINDVHLFWCWFNSIHPDRAPQTWSGTRAVRQQQLVRVCFPLRCSDNLVTRVNNARLKRRRTDTRHREAVNFIASALVDDACAANARWRSAAQAAMSHAVASQKRVTLVPFINGPYNADGSDRRLYQLGDVLQLPDGCIVGTVESLEKSLAGDQQLRDMTIVLDQDMSRMTSDIIKAANEHIDRVRSIVKRQRPTETLDIKTPSEWARPDRRLSEGERAKSNSITCGFDESRRIYLQTTHGSGAAPQSIPLPTEWLPCSYHLHSTWSSWWTIHLRLHVDQLSYGSEASPEVAFDGRSLCSEYMRHTVQVARRLVDVKLSTRAHWKPMQYLKTQKYGQSCPRDVKRLLHERLACSDNDANVPRLRLTGNPKAVDHLNDLVESMGEEQPYHRPDIRP